MKRLLPILLITCLVAAENGSAQAPSEQGFVRIPEGPVLPGCTVENFNKTLTDMKQRRLLKTTGQQTLESLATEYVRHGDEPIPGQWAPIYALNWKTIYEGLEGKVDKNKKPLGGVMFNSRGISVNTCTGVSFPVEIVVSDESGESRTIEIRAAGGTRLL